MKMAGRVIIVKEYSRTFPMSFRGMEPIGEKEISESGMLSKELFKFG